MRTWYAPRPFFPSSSGGNNDNGVERTLEVVAREMLAELEVFWRKNGKEAKIKRYMDLTDMDLAVGEV